MRVADAIVDDGLVLDALLRHREGEMDDPFVVRRCGQHADLERVETFARVAIAQFREMPFRVRDPSSRDNFPSPRSSSASARSISCLEILHASGSSWKTCERETSALLT